MYPNFLKINGVVYKISINLTSDKIAGVKKVEVFYSIFTPEFVPFSGSNFSTSHAKKNVRLKQQKYEALLAENSRSEALAKAQKPDMRFPKKVENIAYTPPKIALDMYSKGLPLCSHFIISSGNLKHIRHMSRKFNTPTLDQVIAATSPKPTISKPLTSLITQPVLAKSKHAYVTHPDNVKNMQIALHFESHLTFICTLIRVEKYNQDIAAGITGDKLLKVYNKASLTLNSQLVGEVMKNANIQGGISLSNVSNSRGEVESSNEFKIIPIKPNNKTTKGLYKGTFVV